MAVFANDFLKSTNNEIIVSLQSMKVNKKCFLVVCSLLIEQKLWEWLPL